MTNKQYRKKERRWKNDYKADSWHLGYIGYSDRLIKQWINKYAGEMKRGERRKDVWYRCKQGGEKMFWNPKWDEIMKKIVKWWKE